jgi:hypothetical protein
MVSSNIVPRRHHGVRSDAGSVHALWACGAAWWKLLIATSREHASSLQLTMPERSIGYETTAWSDCPRTSLVVASSSPALPWRPSGGPMWPGPRRRGRSWGRGPGCREARHREKLGARSDVGAATQGMAASVGRAVRWGRAPTAFARTAALLVRDPLVRRRDADDALLGQGSCGRYVLPETLVVGEWIPGSDWSEVSPRITRSLRCGYVGDQLELPFASALCHRSVRGCMCIQVFRIVEKFGCKIPRC